MARHPGQTGHPTTAHHRSPKPAPSRSRVIATALAKFDSQPDLLADALRSYLGNDGWFG